MLLSSICQDTEVIDSVLLLAHFTFITVSCLIPLHLLSLLYYIHPYSFSPFFFIIHFISSTSTSCLRGQIHLITRSPLSLPFSPVQKVFVWHCPLHMHLNTHPLLHSHFDRHIWSFCATGSDMDGSLWQLHPWAFTKWSFVYEMKDERAKENLTTYSYSTFCTSVCHLLIHGNWVALSIVSWGEKIIKQALHLDQDKMLAAHIDHT